MSHTPQPDDFTGRGYVVFLPYAQGTQSESWRPYAVLHDGTTVRLHVPDDNPFTNERLKPFHRLCCELSGRLDAKNNVLLVSSIAQTEDPFAALGGDQPATPPAEGTR